MRHEPWMERDERLLTQRYGVNYNGSGTGYIVFELGDGKPVFSSESKTECIAKAQAMNGWPINGDEQSYARQKDLSSH